MATDLTILYRGCLARCDYSCWYCPQAKKTPIAGDLEADRLGLERFVDWAEGRRGDRLSVFLTPWGEALVQPWYPQAIARLSHMDHLRRVAAQTNLSCDLAWVAQCRANSVGLWCTYHPSQTSRQAFLEQCQRLTNAGVRHSVGMVGLREHLDEIRAMRRLLPPDTYLWINAYKDAKDYYRPEELAAFAAIDPLFPINTRRHPSLGRRCHCGSRVIAVDHQGTVRRCHFIQQLLGSMYESGFEQRLAPAPCTNLTCGCHIGYVHMDGMDGDETYGDGILERIPRTHIWKRNPGSTG